MVRKTEATHPREALVVYAARVEELVNRGSPYDEAVKLIKRMARLRSAPEQQEYVAALKGRFDRKRNFIKMLG